MYPYNLEQIKIMSEEDSQKNKITEMLILALEDELKDKDYYMQMMDQVNDKEVKEILRQMSLDEQKHYKYLSQIYKQLTGNEPVVQVGKVEISGNILEEITKAFFGELEAVEVYRRLMFLFLNLQIRDMIYEIITDEQAHAAKLNYLYTKYNAKKETEE